MTAPRETSEAPKVLITGGSGFIGGHLRSHLELLGYKIFNLDIVPPTKQSNHSTWRECSILDFADLKSQIEEIRPNSIIHLAALATMEAASAEDFRVNTEGTANVLQAVREIGGVEKLIITSTQHVRAPGSCPSQNEEDYIPHMMYGESKVIAEKLVRNAEQLAHWTIIRPTAIWGPHHPNLVEGLWKLIYTGRYFHPKNDQVIKCYGYVKNVAWQIERILALPADVTNGRTLYLGDGNSKQFEWVNRFSTALTGRSVKTLPLWCIHLASKVGDLLRSLGIEFPIYDSRFHNLTTNNPVPIEPALEILGAGPYSMQEGIRETVEWLILHYNQGSKP
jgi:nucleoside-diphosphate-sugar epimerase